MEYKERLFQNYATTHILSRKGEPTLDEFRSRAAIYGRQFGDILPKDKSARIIDVGCGNGSVVWWLQQDGYTSVEGVDISPEQVEYAKRLGVKNVRCADLKDFLSETKGRYDVVFLRDIIEHLPKGELLSTLDLLHGAMKRGGAIIVQVPNAESPFGGRLRYGDFTHETAFTTGSLSQVLSAAGFGNTRFRSTGPGLSGLRSAPRFILWKFVEAFYKFLIFAEVGRGPKVVSQGIIAISTKLDA